MMKAAPEREGWVVAQVVKFWKVFILEQELYNNSKNMGFTRSKVQINIIPRKISGRLMCNICKIA